MTTGDSDSHSSRGGDSDGPAGAPPENHSHSVENGTKEPPATVIKPKRIDLAALTKIVQVANIAPQATRDQMQALFGYLGKIEDLRLYPTIDLGMQHTSKICFVKFYESSSVGVAQHLTNTVFVDRALIVIPYIGSDIPDESKALELLGSGSLLPGIADPKLPQHVTSQLEGIPPLQVVVTRDAKLLENQLPAYPNLPPTFDSRRIEEIRRTIMVANVDPEVPMQDVMEFCSCAGEVKYFRLCTRDNDPIHYALVEFTEQPSVLEALKLNGTTLGSKFVKVYHATQAIIKPQAKTNEAAQKEIEEAMSHQAQTLLTHGLDGPSKEKRRSRSISRGRHSGTRLKSRSRSRRRSRSRSRSRRRVKRSRSASRSMSRGRVRRSRSRGRVRRSPRRTHRSRSRDRSRRSTSRTHRSKRSGSKKREKKSKKDKDRDRDRGKDREGRENGIKHEESGHKLEVKEEGDRDREREKRKSSPSRSTKEKNRSPNHEKKRSKNKKKKKEESDREESEERSRRSRSSSVDKGKVPLELFNS